MNQQLAQAPLSPQIELLTTGSFHRAQKNPNAQTQT